MCGAGLEKGFIKLEFNESNELLSFQDFVYESCNGSIETEEQKIISDSLKEYYCEDYGNDKSYILTVDLKNVEIKKKETKPNKLN
ncbi:hypothetical protein ACXR6G_06930 [Ancylomarina sp. YFZ004]